MKLELTKEVKIVIWQIGNAALMCKDDDITSAEYEKISLDAINGLVNGVETSHDKALHKHIVTNSSDIKKTWCRFCTKTTIHQLSEMPRQKLDEPINKQWCCVKCGHKSHLLN